MTPQKSSNPYKFSAYRNAALNSASSYTKVAFDTELFDTNNDFNTTNARYTAPVTGYYLFNAVAGNSVAGGTAQFIALYKNGSRIKLGNGNSATTSGQSCTVAALVKLNAGDYVEVFFIGGSGSTMNVGADTCYFDGCLHSL